jgi:hypothetical protein
MRPRRERSGGGGVAADVRWGKERVAGLRRHRQAEEDGGHDRKDEQDSVLQVRAMCHLGLLAEKSAGSPVTGR